MRKLVYYIGASIDGRIAGPADETDFYPLSDEMIAWIAATYPETLPTHLRGHFGVEDAPNESFDTVLMGRGTYRPGLDAGITSPYAHLRQYVISSTLKIDDPAVHVEAGDPLALVRALKAEEGGRDIWLCGGGRLAGALLPEIDEIVLKRYPVVAGTGVPLFGGPFNPTQFVPTEHVTMKNGTQVTWFRRA
ncbi:dihydrofolate reductase family protein [Actinomadura gamaensis]|uniref:Dihydrofolate reductase family protein n=1 Tax=Actinomadura gamaensis TaxID=1763541 RepID=A0ABV9U8Z5_9ACTN